MKSKQEMGARLTTLRKEYNLTIEKMGALVNKSGMAINNIEKGITANPQETTLDLICEKLGTTREWLMLGEGEMLPEGKVKLGDNSVSLSSNPWREEAYQALKDEVKELRAKHSQAMDMLGRMIDRMQPGKHKGFVLTANKQKTANSLQN